MIKRLFIFIFFSFLTANVVAQQYGNEWINYSQKHYKISIPKTGLYRIDFNTLVGAGIPLSSIDPRNFQLFIKGDEQYINVVGEADGVFNNSDYIEFFAKKNDASFDSIAYYNITRLPNPYIALFNDTNCAFLTWNGLINNRRVTSETDINFAGYSAANYFYSEKVEAYSSYYSLGPIFLDVISDPRYVKGEGPGQSINQGQGIQTSFGNLNVFQSPSLPIYVKSSFSGTTENFIAGITYDHELKIDFLNSSNNFTTLSDTTFYGISQLLVEKQTTSDQLQNNSIIRVSSENNALFSAISNATNVHYIYLKYPQIPDFLNTSEQLFFVDNSSTLKTFLDIQNVSIIGSAQVLFYDLTNHKYISTVASGNNVKVLIPNSTGQKQCFLTTTANVNFVNSFFKKHISNSSTNSTLTSYM